ncbi:MAG: ATP synthase F1 subunit epsilon [Thermoanaerobaculia bacterium]
MAATFHLSVVTPEQSVLDTEVKFVALPAHDGEIGVMRNRAPLLVRLEPGVLRADTDGGPRTLYIDGGFAEMADNRLTVLTEAALRPEELDGEAVQAAFDEARALSIPDDAAFAERQRALRRARVQRKLLP